MSKKNINSNKNIQNSGYDTEYLKNYAQRFKLKALIIELMEKEIVERLCEISRETKMDLTKFNLSEESVDDYIKYYPETENTPLIFEYIDSNGVFYQVNMKVTIAIYEDTFRFEYAYCIIKIEGEKLYCMKFPEQEWDYKGKIGEDKLIADDDELPFT